MSQDEHEISFSPMSLRIAESRAVVLDREYRCTCNKCNIQRTIYNFSDKFTGMVARRWPKLEKRFVSGAMMLI